MSKRIDVDKTSMMLASKINLKETVLSKETISKMISGANTKRVSFLTNLIDKYNILYFGVENPSKKEASDVVDIYDSVKKVSDKHIQVVKELKNSTLEQLKEIFSLSDGKKDLSFVLALQKDVLPDLEASISMIINLLKSKNKNQYADDIENYSSYLKLNISSTDAVEKLDEMIADGSYNSTKYDAEYAIKYLMEVPYINEILGEKKDDIAQNYTLERVDFLSFMMNEYFYRRDKSSYNADEIMDLYNSATSKNIGIRKRIIEKFRYAKEGSDKVKIEKKELNSMKELFEKIDESNDTFKFVEKILDEKIFFNSPADINEIIDNVPPKKGIIFIKNINKIVSNTKSSKERVKALREELENPFYMSERQKQDRPELLDRGYIKERSKLEKLQIYLVNEWNKLRYSFVFEKPFDFAENEEQAVEAITADAEEQVQQDKQPAVVVEQGEVEQAVEDTTADTEEQVQQDKQSAVVVEQGEVEQAVEAITANAEGQVQEQSAIVQTVPEINADVGGAHDDNAQNTTLSFNLTSSDTDAGPVILRNNLKETPKERKIRLSNEVNEYVKNILGNKTYEKQNGMYKESVTKMRLTLLPEIFASIRETSKFSREQGKHPRSNNRDALRLYKLINGKNRKLIRYMLKQTNSNKERIYEVKDIISYIETQEKEIANKKYRPAAAKEHYNQLFNEQVEKYGKLKVVRKKKSTLKTNTSMSTQES